MTWIHSAQSASAGVTTTGATEINVPLEPVASEGGSYIFIARGIGTITFHAWNSGAATINCTVYASNDYDLADALWIDRSGTALDTLAANSASAKVYVEADPGFSFYRVKAGDAGGAGVAHVRITQQGA